MVVILHCLNSIQHYNYVAFSLFICTAYGKPQHKCRFCFPSFHNGCYLVCKVWRRLRTGEWNKDPNTFADKLTIIKFAAKTKCSILRNWCNISNFIRRLLQDKASIQNAMKKRGNVTFLRYYWNEHWLDDENRTIKVKSVFCMVSLGYW